MKQRVLTPELMDDSGLDTREHRRALLGLSRLNRLSRAPVRVAREVELLLHAQGVPVSQATLLDRRAAGATCSWACEAFSAGTPRRHAQIPGRWTLASM